jgi:hypothetical protein
MSKILSERFPSGAIPRYLVSDIQTASVAVDDDIVFFAPVENGNFGTGSGDNRYLIFYHAD